MSGDTKNIIVIDDEKYICNIILEAISEFQDYKVHKFTDPVKAMDHIAHHGVDLVLTDLVMGDYSGVQILEHTLHNHPDAVVILMTGYPTIKTAISVLKKGGYDYLIKPFKLEDLKSTIKRGLENQAIKRENVELRSQLELMKVAEEVSRGIRLHPLLHLITESAVKVLPAESVAVLLRARKNKVFYPKCTAGSAGDDFTKKFLLGKGEQSLELIEKRKPVIENDTFTSNGIEYKRSLISYPLISRGKVIGLLNLVYIDRFSHITPGQKRMISLLVSNAAAAVESNYLDKSLRRSYFQTIKALANAVEARDRYTAGHTDRVYRIAKVIARKMGWDAAKMAELRTGCILHDIGKIGVPDSILNKPGKLTDYERNIMMKHPEMGTRILYGIPFLEPIMPYIISHHEKYDGSGYPKGLKEDEIPIEGRLLAVVDTFDAITSDRPYRDGRSASVAIDELQKFRGSQFDPLIVDLFTEAYESGLIKDGILLYGRSNLKMKMLIPS